MTEPGAGEPDGYPTDGGPSGPPQPPPASAAPIPAWPYGSPPQAQPPQQPQQPPQQPPPQPLRTAAGDVWLPPEPMVGAPPPAEPGPWVRSGPGAAWRPRPYPQLFRGPGFRWWRPLASVGTMLVAVVAIFGVAIVGGALLVALAALTGRGTDASSTFSDDWAASPGGLLFTNLLLAALIPASMAAVWLGFGWRPRWLGSVVGGLRWPWLAACVGVSVVVLVVPGVLLTLFTDDLSTWTPEQDWPLLLAVVVLTTPLQAAGEEYAFRGWLPQTIGSVFANARVGALAGNGVASVLFALAHGQQDPWLFADRFVFGLVACWLVWRTGGLEAGIAVHAVNNLAVFALTIAQGELLDSITITRAGAGEVIFDVVTLVVVGAVVTGLAFRLRVARLFVPPP